MSRDIADLHPCLRPVASVFLERCLAAGINVLITQTRRTAEEQQALYDQGRVHSGKIVTNAKPGQSPHNFGLAFDIAFRIPETGEITWGPPRDHGWDFVGHVGESLGLIWGGRFLAFVDRPHFEWPNWREVACGGDPPGGSDASGAGGGS